MSEIKRIPKYKLIENDIIDKIISGTYVENQPLPTEHELAKQYQCSRVTVRQALSNLAHKGYIRKTHGSGSFVNKTKTIQRTHLLKSFSEEMIELGKKPSSEVHTFTILEAGNTMAKVLGISPEDKVYFVERTRFADDYPVLFERSFLAVDLHPNLSIQVLKTSKYKYAEDHNLIIDYSHQNITPMFPPKYIAEKLQISEKQPIIRIINVTYMSDGTPFDYTELFLHPELYQLNVVKKR